MYEILIDSREKMPWTFQKTDLCAGSKVIGLKTGDYAISGLENRIVVERKRNTAEWSQNIIQERFERELNRFSSFDKAFIICDFDLHDILAFPHNSGIPKFMWPKIKMLPQFILKKTSYFQIKYNVNILFAGAGNGATLTQSLFNEAYISWIKSAKNT